MTNETQGADSAERTAVEIEATQITLGEGLVDITRIDHGGRTGVLFRPRKERIPFGEPGELPEGTYWPGKSDVVLWVSGEGPGVAIKALADLAPSIPAPSSPGVPEEMLRDLAKRIGEAADDEFVDWQIELVLPVLRDAFRGSPPSSPGVPDSVRALSEAASEDWATNDATPYILGPQIDGEHDRFEVIARGPHGHAKSGDAIRKWQANRMFAVAAVNFVRTLIAAQPAGQSTGLGTGEAQTMRARAAEVARNSAAVCGDGELYIAHKIADEIEALPLSAPSSPRMGQADAETLTSTVCVAHHEIEQKIAEGGEDLTSTDCVALWEAEQQLAAHAGQEGAERPDGAIHNGREHLRRLGLYGFTANDGHALDCCEDYIGAQQCFEVMAEALAARPADPEAQGAWHWTDRDGHPVRDAEQGEQWLLTWSEASAAYDINCIDGDWPHGDAIKLLCMDAWKWLEMSPGAPPASSGQEG